MGNLIIGAAFLAIAFLTGLGLWVAVDSGVLKKDDPPLAADWDIRQPEDDGVTTLTLGGGDTVAGAPRATIPGESEAPSPFADPLRERRERRPPPAVPDLVPRRYGHYVVQQGDTLSEIAERELGRSALWQTLIEHNRDQIREPNDLRPGQRLKVPLWLREAR